MGSSGKYCNFQECFSLPGISEKEIIWRGIIKAGALIAVPIAISYILRSNYTESNNTLEAVILQPNIDPYTEKYNTTDNRIGELLLQLSAENVTDSTAIIVAPETVFADGTVLPNFPNSEAAFYSRQLLEQYPGINF